MEDKGKNFSTNNSSGQRRKSDFYQTPYSLTTQLMEVEHFYKDQKILEPCCGNGAIVKVLRNYFNNSSLYYYDKYVYDDFNKLPKSQKDFLTETKQYDCIITNPPFSLATEFILHAKKICQDKFTFLLPLSYLHGVQRYKTIYQDREFPLKCVYIFTRYPMLSNDIREDGKYKTGMMVYAWYVWDRNPNHRSTNEPIIRWINNQEYVLNKGDKI